MKITKYLCVGLIFFSSNLIASPNSIAEKNKIKTAEIENLIKINIALTELKDKEYLHPFFAKNIAKPTQNPFLKLSTGAVADLTKAGINISVIAKYKALYLEGEYHGAGARDIINTDPNTVLVIGSKFRSHDKVFSLGPVYSEGSLEDIISNNVIWYGDDIAKDMYKYYNFIGMPTILRGSSTKPFIKIPTKHELYQMSEERRQECKNYADYSNKQNAQNIALRCNFSGIRWSNTWKYQYDWCMTKLRPMTDVETDFRSHQLENCKALIVNAENPKNRPKIPDTCNDASENYGAVKQINHSFRYAKRLASPVQNGVIIYDYNRDKKPDYVFIERKEEHARAVICFSEDNSYQRQITDISFTTESGNTRGTSEYSLTQKDDLLSVFIEYFEHNAGTSFRSTSYRFLPEERKFKIIENEAHSAGILQNGFILPVTIPETPILF